MINFTKKELEILENRLNNYRILEDIPEKTVNPILNKINLIENILIRNREKRIMTKKNEFFEIDNSINKYLNQRFNEIKKNEKNIKITYVEISKNLKITRQTVSTHIEKNQNLKYQFEKINEHIEKIKIKKISNLYNGRKTFKGRDGYLYYGNQEDMKKTDIWGTTLEQKSEKVLDKNRNPIKWKK